MFVPPIVCAPERPAGTFASGLRRLLTSDGLGYC